MPKIKLKTGINMYYELHGQGESYLVLNAGLSADHGIWQEVVDDLKQSFRVLIFDNRGTGQSETPDEPYSVKMLARDTLALMDVLEIKKTYFLGHSMGAAIAQEICLNYPEKIVKAILLSSYDQISDVSKFHIDSIFKLQENNINSNLILETVLPWLFGSKVLSDQVLLEHEKNRMINKEYPQSSIGLKHQVNALNTYKIGKENLKKIDVETLVLVGEEDRLTPLRHSEILNQEIPKARLKIYPNCGHMVQLEEPKKLVEDIKQFFC
ncbi:alpha/beta hydrolase [bacterium]|nr:alpha/beta hydrolase [bacterium]